MSSIKVNEDEWNKLSEDERSGITKIMREHGFLSGSGDIVGDPSVPKAKDTVVQAASHLKSSARATKSMALRAAGGKGTAPAGFNWCEVGCDIAEAGAVAACSIYTGPAAPVCIAAAHAGGSFCRSKCH